MATVRTFTDVLTDDEPIGLAESFQALTDPITIVLVGDDPAEVGSKVYFGLDLPIGEIGEVQGEVLHVETLADQVQVTVRVEAVDAALGEVIVRTLQADNAADTEAADGGATEPVWGVGLKQTNGAFAIVVNAPAGLLTAVQLAKLSEIAAAGANLVKLTHAQRAVVLVNADQLDGIDRELAAVGLRKGVLHHGIRNIRACCGQLCKWCRNVDAVRLAGTIDERLYGRSTKFDVKIAVSDCQRNCSEAYCADIGLIGANGCYRVVLGGRGSSVPFRAVNFADAVSTETVADMVVGLVDWYEQHADEGERLWKTLQRLGQSRVSALDFSAVAQLTAAISDGVDETTRLRDLLARIAGAELARAELT